MSQPNMAFSAEIQTLKVARYMNEFGSINRYEADFIGVCHLAARIKELKERGLIIDCVDEDGVEDFHKLKHNGIRRYFINWQKMTPEKIKYFTQVIDTHRIND